MRATIVLAFFVLQLAGCGAARQGGETAPGAAGAEVPSAGPLGVLVAPSWGGEQALASSQAIYTDPGDIPRLQLQGEQGERLPLRHTHVEARLTGFVAEVEVRQTYENPHGEPIEAIYIFPLPENSAVNHMRMEIGDRVIEAEIRRREEARREYEEARREGFTAALLEQERPNVFTQSVANIAPGERIEVAIRYVQDLTYDAGQYEFVFPMVVGPRFVPGQALGGAESGSGTYADTDQVPDASRITPPYLGRGERSGHDISLNVVADATLSVGEIEVPTHEVWVQTATGDGTVRIALPERDSIPNRDFVLRYRVAGEQPRATLFLSSAESGGFFSLAVHPPTLDVEQLVGRREIVFVVDISGSMHGLPLSLCRTAMRDALRRLRPVDTFNIITFAGRTQMAFERPRPANDANLRAAFDVVEGMRAGGGTYMADAIAAALSPEVEQGRHRYVFFLTDGYVGNEAAIVSGSAALVSALEARGQRARVFGFGVGSSVNRRLLDGLSTAGNGVTVYATSREDPSRAVNQFFRYIDHAVLEGVRVEWADLGPREVAPAELPDLFASHAMIVHGRYERPPTGQLVVSAVAGGRQVTLPVTVRTAEVQGAPTEVLGSLWARSRVAELEERLVAGEAALGEEITDLGLEHHLVTRFTSFVAVDRSRRVGQGDPRTVVQPVEVPEGVDAMAAGARTTRVASPPPPPGPPRAEATVRRGTAAAPRPRPGRALAGEARPSSAAGGRAHGRARADYSDEAVTPAASMPMVQESEPDLESDADGSGDLAPTKTSGRAAVARALRPLRPRLLACYEEGLGRVPGLAGTIVLRLEVAPDGRVRSPTVTSATLTDTRVQQCVARVLATARLPAHRDPGARLVTHSLVFGPDPARPGRGTLR